MKIEFEDYNGNTILVADFQDVLPEESQEERQRVATMFAEEFKFSFADTTEDGFRLQDTVEDGKFVRPRMSDLMGNIIHLYISKKFRSYN